jgi:hypothetical protein
VKPLPQGLFAMRLLGGPSCQPKNQAGMQLPPITIEPSDAVKRRLPHFFGPRR